MKRYGRPTEDRRACADCRERLWAAISFYVKAEAVKRCVPCWKNAYDRRRGDLTSK